MTCSNIGNAMWNYGLLTVTGEAIGQRIVAGTYAEVRRKWSAGDTVELSLPMEPKLIEAHPQVRNLNGYVAVQRGPVVYCLELPRAAGGERLWNEGVFLPESIELTPSHVPDFLGGVTVLKGKALTSAGRESYVAQLPKLKAPPTHDWGPELYRPFEPREVPTPETGTVDIELIPYFAWANRGVSFMEVWIPLAR